MKIDLRKIWLTIVFIWLFFFLMMLTSCKSKHKVIQRQTTAQQTHKQSAVNQITKNDIVLDSFAKKGSSSFSIKSIKSIVLTQADSSKHIVITDEAGKSLNIKGANVVIENALETKALKDSLINKLVKNDKTTTQTANQTKENTSVKTTNRTADSNVHNTSTWFWVLLIVVALALVYVFRNRIIGWVKTI